MEALSQDLRERVIAAWRRGEGGKKALARRFKISERSVHRIIKRWEETGSVAAQPSGGDQRGKFTADSREALRQMHEQEPDATLARFQQRCQDELNIECSIMAICRELKKLGLTLKKKL